MTTTDAQCPACDAPLQAGDRFCEQCGTRLDEPDDDRVELDLVTAAAVSDRGRVHRRNEDAFHLKAASAERVAVVVCDGISSASAGNVAARDAAAAAGAVLDDAIADPAVDGREAIVRAVEAAGGAVERVPWTTRTGRVDPSCTIVSALCRPEEIVVGWLGDSRAYWLDGDGLRQLTVDDSLAEEGVARGMLTPEQAARSPFLHSITHWVGPDAPARPPRMVALRPERPGRLIVCTDGLWNYMPTVDELSDLIGALPAGATAAATARSLTDTALTRGGRDNITVAVVDMES